MKDKESTKAMRNIEKLGNGFAVSNVKEYLKTAVFEVVQYWKEHK